MRATQRMQVLQPQIQRIQRKYAARKDPRSKEAMQREIMALQQRHNANPLGSYLLR
ncbi:YidC/Oxa1 family membrane protein insertase [Bifidobacterium longum]